MRGSNVDRHPGQIPRSGMRAGIQYNSIYREFPGFRVSLDPLLDTGQAAELARNDTLFVF